MGATVDEACPIYSAFFAQAGASCAMILAAAGAAYGSAKSGVSVVTTGASKPDIIIRSLLPVIMAGMLSIFGLVVSVFISLLLDGSQPMTLFAAAVHLAAGLSVGLSSLAAGYCIGVLGDQCVRAYAKQPKLFNAMLMLLAFAEMLGMFGLIAAMILISKSKDSITC